VILAGCVPDFVHVRSNNSAMLGPQTLCHTSMVRVSVCQHDRIHLTRTSADPAQRVDHHWIVLGPGGIDERDRVPIAYQTPIRTRPNNQEHVGRHLDDLYLHHIPPSRGGEGQPYALVNGSSVPCPGRTRGYPRSGTIAIGDVELPDE
jgi:hypothetical protein